MSTTQSKPREDVEPYILRVLRGEKLSRAMEYVHRHLTVGPRPPQDAYTLDNSLRRLVNSVQQTTTKKDALGELAALCIEQIEQYQA